MKKIYRKKLETQSCFIHKNISVNRCIFICDPRVVVKATALLFPPLTNQTSQVTNMIFSVLFSFTSESILTDTFQMNNWNTRTSTSQTSQCQAIQCFCSFTSIFLASSNYKKEREREGRNLVFHYQSFQLWNTRTCISHLTANLHMPAAAFPILKNYNNS